MLHFLDATLEAAAGVVLKDATAANTDNLSAPSSYSPWASRTPLPETQFSACYLCPYASVSM